MELLLGASLGPLFSANSQTQRPKNTKKSQHTRKYNVPRRDMTTKEANRASNRGSKRRAYLLLVLSGSSGLGGLSLLALSGGRLLSSGLRGLLEQYTHERGQKRERGGGKSFETAFTLPWATRAAIHHKEPNTKHARIECTSCEERLRHQSRRRNQTRRRTPLHVKSPPLGLSRSQITLTNQNGTEMGTYHVVSSGVRRGLEAGL